MRYNLHLAVNNLSFGFCSFHILREFWKRGLEVDLFLIGGNLDLSSFNKAEPELVNWIHQSAKNAPRNFSRTNPTLRLWHVGGSHESVGTNQNLFTFFELVDGLTPVEKNILNNQSCIFVSSEETKQTFLENGVTSKIVYCPLGYDTLHFNKLNKKYYDDNVTCWLISGKAEIRKSTPETIRAWVKKFGNNSAHILHLSIFNPFLSPEQNAQWLNQILEGKKYHNIVNLPYVQTLSQLNDVYNAADIVLDLAKNEGWSLPSFHTLGLGKHAIIHNSSAMKGWANKENSVLVESSGKTRAVDGMFFSGQGDYNIGNFWTWSEPDLMRAFDEVLVRKAISKTNTEGLKLREQFTWEKTVDTILENLT
jgi:hypothetical protein